jgi:hypothetical protein
VGEKGKSSVTRYLAARRSFTEPLNVALLQAAAADPVGDLPLNSGGNAAAQEGGLE